VAFEKKMTKKFALPVFLAYSFRFVMCVYIYDALLFYSGFEATKSERTCGGIGKKK